MARRPFEIPEGMNLEQLIEAAEAYRRMKRNQYNAAHRDQILRQRINSAMNLLKKHGYIIIPLTDVPAGDPWAWDELTAKMMTAAIRASVKETREAGKAAKA